MIIKFNNFLKKLVFYNYYSWLVMRIIVMIATIIFIIFMQIVSAIKHAVMQHDLNYGLSRQEYEEHKETVIGSTD